MLSFHGYDIVFQEVPNEVSLAIEVGGCPFRCAGCHSPYMWEDGPFTCNKDLWSLIERYKDFITCVCFMGGDHDPKSFIAVMKKIVGETPLKICLYTGREGVESLEADGIMDYLDYVKVGSYKAELGGLSSPKTNQRFYKVKGGLIAEDLTEYFQKKGLKN